MKRIGLISVIVGLAAFVIVVLWYTNPRTSTSDLETVSLRLQWIGQAQFAGYIVAKELGFYEEAGIDVDIRPAGPDLKPHTTVASGTDDFGVGVSNQIILARGNGVPLVIVAQIFQDSANRYVLFKDQAIDLLSELRGETVGLWLGGDEAEFVAMLASEGLSPSDVKIVPQEFSVVPFLRGEYRLSQVTVYNELLQIQKELKSSQRELQILSPGDYDAALPGDLLFTTESLLQRRPDLVARFVRASIRGWRFAIENPNEAAQLVVEAYPELNLEEQIAMLNAIMPLIIDGVKIDEIGLMKSQAYGKAQDVLVVSGQMTTPIDIEQLYKDVLDER